ncbi:MAG: hypothetical protein KQH59_18325 [Desulfobulbaceae bacterium]|nr:hypothetical protein [Desulfobulbaceae bacterium]
MPVIGSYSDSEMARHRSLVVGDAEVDLRPGSIILINRLGPFDFSGFVDAMVPGVADRFAVPLEGLVAQPPPAQVLCAACGESAALAGESVCGACLEELMAGGPAWR